MDSQASVRRISHYSSDMDILLVGEGDFSFAAALARAFQTAPRLLATSLDSREMLHLNYGGLTMEIRLAELTLRDVVVINDVDVKKIIQHPSLRHFSFDCIVYNFPHSGFVFGLDERDTCLIQKHRRLMQSFFKNVRRLLKEGGEVHAAHHMCKPYSEWRLEEVAAKSGFKLRACHIFEAQGFPGYTPRRGAGANANGTFPLRNPVTFIFSIPRFPPPPCIIPSHPPSPPLCIVPPTSRSTRPCISSCPPKPSVIASPPPSPFPTVISSHPNNNRNINSHRNPYNPPPSSPCETSSHHEYYPLMTSSLHQHPPAIAPPKPSMIASPIPSPSPTIISTQRNNCQSVNSHVNPYNSPAPPLKTSSHQPSSSDQTKPFSWISAFGQIINLFLPTLESED